LLQTVDRFILEESVRIELKPVVISCPVPLSLSSENCSADAANVVLSAQVGKAIVANKNASPIPWTNVQWHIYADPDHKQKNVFCTDVCIGLIVLAHPGNTKRDIISINKPLTAI